MTRRHTAPRRAATRPHRRPTKKQTVALAGSVLAVAALVAVFTSRPTILGFPDRGQPAAVSVPAANNIDIDLDHDGTPDTTIKVTHHDGTTEDVPLTDITSARDTITNLVAPHPNPDDTATADHPTGNPQLPTNPNVVQTLLTPAGPRWWTMVTSMAPDTHLWEGPTPREAIWFSMTESPTTGDNPYNVHTYTAVHAGFPTEQAAADYIQDIGLDARINTFIRVAMRGTVITLTPNYIDAASEPLPIPRGEDAEALTTLHPKAAAWTINYGNSTAAKAANAYDAKASAAITAFYGHLGYTTTAQWNGVAANPDGPWHGHISGYNPDKFDPIAAADDIATTTTLSCVSASDCQQTNSGLLDIGLAYTYAPPGNGDVRFGRNPLYLPTNAPANAVLRFGIDEGYANGLINGSHATPQPPVQLITGWITPDMTQVIYTHDKPAPLMPLTN